MTMGAFDHPGCSTGSAAFVSFAVSLPNSARNPSRIMNRIFGYIVGLVWLGLAWGAFQRGANGRAMDQADVGVWWTIIAGLLTIAALGALIGTTLHSRADHS